MLQLPLNTIKGTLGSRNNQKQGTNPSLDPKLCASPYHEAFASKGQRQLQKRINYSRKPNESHTERSGQLAVIKSTEFTSA